MPGEPRERGKVGVEGRQRGEPAVGEVQRCQRGEEREAFEGRLYNRTGLNHLCNSWAAATLHIKMDTKKQDRRKKIQTMRWIEMD